jgi:hypothetical protein
LIVGKADAQMADIVDTSHQEEKTTCSRRNPGTLPIEQKDAANYLQQIASGFKFAEVAFLHPQQAPADEVPQRAAFDLPA